jgi:hypothetical protein
MCKISLQIKKSNTINIYIDKNFFLGWKVKKMSDIEK